MKDLIKAFYGKDPEYSYWNGCSQGGRQGLAIAQRYPELYDGIIAAAPAIDYAYLSSYGFLGQQTMNELGEYPHPCEFDQITRAAITACDALDGVVDGVISSPNDCRDWFNPFEVVGETIEACPQSNGTVVVSETAAKVVKALWEGLTFEGELLYPGINPDANLTGDRNLRFLALTECQGGICIGLPPTAAPQWLSHPAAKDPNLDMSTLTRQEYDELVYSSNKEYSGLISMLDPDPSRFKKAGGKMITFHGLSDPLIPPCGTERYYKAVMEKVEDTRDFYRYFEVPGLAHCQPGVSSMPDDVLS